MIKKTNPAFIVLVFIILWINQKYVLQALLSEAVFFDRAINIFDDWDYALSLFPEYLEHNILHGLFLCSISIITYFGTNRIVKVGKSYLLLFLIPSLTFLFGVALSVLDHSTFTEYTLRFNLVSSNLEDTNTYQLLTIINITEVFCVEMIIISAVLLSRMFTSSNTLSRRLKALPRSFWLSSFLFYTLIFVLFILVFQSPSLDILDLLLFRFIYWGAFLTLLSAIIVINLEKFKEQKRKLLESLLQCIIIVIGGFVTAMFISSNFLSHFPFGQLLAGLITTILYQVFLLVVPLILGWTQLVHRYDLFGVKSGVRLESEIRNLSSELSFLKYQINPHFLFNSLNTVYGIALEENSPKSAEGIQKLSNMMRFMLQENTAEKILIQQELKYIKDYIDFQQLRLDENMPVELDVNISEGCSGEIAPMLMIPLIENAFKHGISNINKSHISINLACRDHFLSLVVKNTKQKTTQLQSGIGIKNVQKRLAIYYPDCHSFETSEDQQFYEVKLKIEFP